MSKWLSVFGVIISLVLIIIIGVRITHPAGVSLPIIQQSQGPPRVGIQAGHDRINELPDEFSDNAARSTGTSAGGFTEQQVNLAIAEQVASILRGQGMIVDILPATIPVDYQADAFVSIHADGSTNASARGFKVTGARYDRTGEADDLSQSIKTRYAAVTNLPYDDNITRNMYNYYAFNAWRYDHSIARSTPGVIIETGFLTNLDDRLIITGSQALVAKGIADGISGYINANR